MCIALISVLLLTLFPMRTTALFFTDSKENDYPRIGRSETRTKQISSKRRSDSYPSSVSHSPSGRDVQESLERITKTVVRLLDTNGDKVLSLEEYMPCFRNRVSRSVLLRHLLDSIPLETRRMLNGKARDSINNILNN